MQAEIEPLGNIVLEQERDLADAVALGVGIGLDRPLAGRGARQQRDGEGAPAEPLVGQGGAPVFDAVRALDDQRQRQAGLGRAFGVAQQRGGEHRLAGAVDAALGVQECVEALGRVAAGDAAIGEVEGVLRQVEEAIVVAERGDQEARGRTALAARQPGVEIDPAVGAGRLRRQHFVVARDELEFDAGERRGGAERLHDRVQAVLARNGRQPEVGNDHPLRGELHGLARVGIAGLRRTFPWPRGDQIDAGLHLADRVEHGKLGDDVLVELGGDVHRPAPHLGPVLRLDLFSARRIDGLEKVVAVDGRQQIAVADAVDVDRDLGRVDGDERRALLALARQHVGPAGEMSLGRAVADIDFVVGGLQQRFADRRRQALAQHDRVALAVLEALDANLLILVGDGGVRRTGDGDIGRKIRLALELLGEVETDAGRSRFIVDLVVEDAEPVALAHVLVGLADVDRIAPGERGAESVERRAPHLAPREKIAENRQRVGLRGGRRRPLIGGVGRGRAAGHEIVAAIQLGVVGLDRQIRQGEPVGGVLGRGGDGRARQLLRGVEFGRSDGGSGVPAQFIGRPALDLRADRRRLVAQRLGQPHDVARHVLARVGLDLGADRRAGCHEQDEEGDGAQRMEHGSTPARRERRSSRHHEERNDAASQGRGSVDRLLL